MTPEKLRVPRSGRLERIDYFFGRKGGHILASMDVQWRFGRRLRGTEFRLGVGEIERLAHGSLRFCGKDGIGAEAHYGRTAEPDKAPRLQSNWRLTATWKRPRRMLVKPGVPARKSEFEVGLYCFDAIETGMRWMSAFMTFPFTAIRPSNV